jgi:hypothetical protein
MRLATLQGTRRDPARPMRGKLVRAQFSGSGLTVRAFSAATTRTLADERAASLESQLAIAKTRAATSPLVSSKGLRIVRLESGVERPDVGRYGMPECSLRSRQSPGYGPCSLVWLESRTRSMETCDSSPARSMLEDARVSAARLSVRGRLRSHDTKQSGAFLFRYGAWSIGALVDEMGVTPRFGVGERWLERRSAASE